MLILYPVSLLNLFINSSSLCLESLGFPAYRIMSSAYNDNFTSFLGYLSFLFFFFFVWLLWPRHPVPCWIEVVSCESCPIPDFSGKAFNFTPLSFMLSGGCHTWLLLLCSFYTCFGSSFYHECMLNFYKCFFLHLLRWSCSFYLLLIWCITLLCIHWTALVTLGWL